MKKGIIITSFSIVFIATLLLVQHKNNVIQHHRIIHLNEGKPELMSTKHQVTTVYEEDIAYDVHMAAADRESITFIMNGGDSGNGYYKAAKKHYQMNPSSEYETIVEHCNSILSIVEHLQDTPTMNGEPWGKINIIKYNSDWKGIHILTEEERTAANEIVEAMDYQSFNPLGNHIIDSETEIMVDGTGIGNNEDLLELIAIAFGGNDEERPIIRSSKFITTFDSTDNESRKYLTESFFGFFPSSDVIQDEVLVTQLQNNYPEEEMDWWEALDRTIPRFPGDAYTIYEYEDDLTTVCILRALTIENDEAPYTPLPFEPTLNDDRFYTTITATPKNEILSFNE